VWPGTRSATVTPDWTLPEWRLFEWSRL